MFEDLDEGGADVSIEKETGKIDKGVRNWYDYEGYTSLRESDDVESSLLHMEDELGINDLNNNGVFIFKSKLYYISWNWKYDNIFT